ncbi:putative reverse transcriptase domain-containing protein [Tanacetum coccineum]
MVVVVVVEVMVMRHNALGYSTFRCNPDLGVLQIAVMSSASSAVTYTSVYTDSEPGRVFWGADEEVSDGGSPRVIVLGYDGLPIQPVAPPSPDYIPDSEEPQTPPVPQDEDEREPMFIQPHDPDYVPEPIYPEYIPLEDEHEFLAEEQPLPPVVSPTAESPGYVVESDPEEDPEEYEDDETEDGPVDYPMDGGEDGDDDDGDSSGDDADDEDEDEEDEDDKEEEHLALADSVVVPTVEPASISLPPEAEVERLLAMPTPPPSPPISLSPPSVGERLARCMAPSAHSSPPPVPSPLLPSSGCPTQIQTLRIASTQALVDAVTTALPSPPLPPLPPSLYIPPPVDRRDDIPESERPPRKRSCLFALGSSESYGLARATNYEGIDDAPGDGAHYGGGGLCSERLSSCIELRRQAQMVETLRVIKDMSRDGYMQGRFLLALREQKKKRRARQPGPDVRVPDHQDAFREMIASSSSFMSFYFIGIVKFATCTLLGAALTWWNCQIRTLGSEAYSMTWEVLKKKMTDKYCPHGEIKKLEIELRNLKFVANETEKVDKYISGLPDNIYGNVKSARPKTLDETIKLANDLMDQKLRTYTKRQSDNKRKADDSSRNNHGEKKPYGGSLPKCTKCHFHHNGLCTQKCHKYNKVWHFARDCRSFGNTNIANTQKGNGTNPKGNGCFECGAPGHFKRDFGNGEKKGNASRDPDSNVVTGTFLLNNCYASILFDTGADRSLISTAFSSLINITPTPLENGYDVELADRKIVRAQISAKKEEDKSEGKKLKDVPIVRDFPKVFPEDLSGLPPARLVEF